MLLYQVLKALLYQMLKACKFQQDFTHLCSTCAQVDNLVADQNESEAAQVTEMKGCNFPAQRRLLEGFKRKALNVPCSAGSPHLCLSLQPLSLLDIEAFFLHNLSGGYKFTTSLFHSKQLSNITRRLKNNPPFILIMKDFYCTYSVGGLSHMANLPNLV